MRVTYRTVINWLQTDEARSCTSDELCRIADVLDPLIDAARNREDKARKLLAQFDAQARAAGFSSYADMQRALGHGQPGQAAPAAAVSPHRDFAPPRRPYLIPDDADTDAFAVYAGRVPPPVQEFLNRNPDWSLEEMHYKRIAAARRARGLPANKPYDPLTKHAELMSRAIRNPRRKQSP